MEQNNFLALGEFIDNLVTAVKTSPLIYIPHYDVEYVEDALLFIKDELDVADKNGLLSYDNAFGVRDLETNRLLDTKGYAPKLDNTLEYMIAEATGEKSGDDDDDDDDRGHFVIKETSVLMLPQNFESLHDAKIQSLILNFCKLYNRGKFDADMTLIIVGEESGGAPESATVPDVIKQLCTIVEIPSPTESEIGTLIRNLIAEKNIRVSRSEANMLDMIMADLTRTLQGLQLPEIKHIVRSAVFMSNERLNLNTVKYALKQKKKFVKKSGIIEVVDTDIDFSKIGGLQNLRNDLKKKGKIFQNLTYALDTAGGRLSVPKGILIIGMPGCGKSMIAKSIASEFKVSLLRLDVNRLMGKYVGESETNLRKALRTAEAAHPCVLWIDEIEKAFAGVDSGNNDIVMRLMGHFLTWMQERRHAVYVVATANDTLKPELMRKGRFDEVYYVAFPTRDEALDILKKKLESYRGNKIYDLADLTDDNMRKVADRMQGNRHGGFSGAEIEYAVGQLVEQAFLTHLEQKENNDSTMVRPVALTAADLIKIVNDMKPTVLSNESNENGPISRISKIGKLLKKASV